MSQMIVKRPSSRARIPQHECHGKDCASGERNKYYLGKHLTPDSYQIEQDHTIGRRRLINRTVHGWGVVSGFELSTKDPGGHAGEILIGEGFALDALGRELIQVHQVWLSLNNLLLLNDKGQAIRMDGCLDQRFTDDKCSGDCWMLTAHYAERTTGLKRISDPCRCDREEWDRTCETVVYALKRVECSECCKPWECGLKCCCPPDAGCCSGDKGSVEAINQKIREFTEKYEREIARLEREGSKNSGQQIKRFEEELALLVEQRNKITSKRHARGGCACLCEHLTGLNPSADCARLTDVDDCTHADLGNGIALACLDLKQDDCGKWVIATIADACGPRRLVKRNDLLFDLINGCDVTTIKETGWARWHRRSVSQGAFTWTINPASPRARIS